MPETKISVAKAQKGWQPGRFHAACMRKRLTSGLRRIAAQLDALK